MQSFHSLASATVILANTIDGFDVGQYNDVNNKKHVCNLVPCKRPLNHNLAD